MILKETYEQSALHDCWEATYRTGEQQNRLNDSMMDRIIAQVRPHSGALFLDAGCGVAAHAIRIAERGYECVAIDLSETIIARARANVDMRGLSSKILLACHPLETLPFADATFDCVHCRGVLMHIPGWEIALANLCRVLKPGGKIVILESNHRSLEAMLVRTLRRLKRAKKSTLVKTIAGLEFWSEQNGNPFVVRIADINYLARTLGSLGVNVTAKFATEFLGIGRVPAGPLRNFTVAVNRLYFAMRLPSLPSIGVAVIGEKRC